MKYVRYCSRATNLPQKIQPRVAITLFEFAVNEPVRPFMVPRTEPNDYSHIFSTRKISRPSEYKKLGIKHRDQSSRAFHTELMTTVRLLKTVLTIYRTGEKFERYIYIYIYLKGKIAVYRKKV